MQILLLPLLFGLIAMYAIVAFVVYVVCFFTPIIFGEVGNVFWSVALSVLWPVVAIVLIIYLIAYCVIAVGSLIAYGVIAVGSLITDGVIAVGDSDLIKKLGHPPRDKR